MNRGRWLDRLAAVTLGVAAIACAWAIVSAVRLTPTSDPLSSERTPASSDSLSRTRRDSTPIPDIGVAVSRNVFSPSRRAPAVAYRLSTAYPVADMAMEGALRERIDPVVLGTAVGANGSSFAMCSYEDASAVVVRVGDQLGPYTVVAIARGRVTFRDVDGTRLEVESPTSPDGELP
jgi:hypothetical protein